MSSTSGLTRGMYIQLQKRNNVQRRGEEMANGGRIGPSQAMGETAAETRVAM